MTREEVEAIMEVCWLCREYGKPEIIGGKCDGLRTGDGGGEPPLYCQNCFVNSGYGK